MKLKLWFVASALGASCVALGGVAGALLAPSTLPKPEIDRASATLQLGGTLSTPVQCKGEDRIGYETYGGSWTGSENQIVPDPTDYNLSGNLTVSGISWTINLATGRGVLVGKTALTSATGLPSYLGTIVVVTQGLPNSTAAPATGRGWIVANFKLPDDGVAGSNDDYLYANVEFPNMNLGGANGTFGDNPGTINPPNVPDYSVVANTPPKSTAGC
jgi:hypothetical protein